MSKIGRKPINVLPNVTIQLSDNILTVTGPKGILKQEIHPKVKLIISENIINVEKKSNDKLADALQGTINKVVCNMITGVSEGFEKKLEIIGVGFRVQLQGDKLTFNLGFSHPIEYVAPEGISFKVEKNIISISGIDKQLVGQVAAQIRDFKKPEPYKGKGIKYIDEIIKRKAGKAASKTA